MGRKCGVGRAGPSAVNIEAQIGVMHNPTFPLSSPMLREKQSTESSRSGLVVPHHNLLSSPDPSISAFTDSSSEDNIEQYGFQGTSWAHRQQESQGGFSEDRSTLQNQKNTMGLHLVTDFSKSLTQKATVLSQVPVKQVKPSDTRVVSVISQKGVQIYPSPIDVVNQEDVTFRQALATSKHNNRHAAQLPSRPRPSDHDRPERPISDKSIVIGLCIPENELESHRDLMFSAANLATPVTPAIVLTPPEPVDSPSRQHVAGLMISNQSRRPISSMYQTVICHESPTEDSTPPVPPLPAQNQPSRSYNPFRKSSPAQDMAQFEDLEEAQRYSEDSKEHILSNGHMTPRPKSQGWWNLLMSPMLSRASSLASRKGQDLDADAPPVPRMPSKKGKQISLPGTCSNLSPETPRRQGLARVESTWSRWTELEEERQQAAQSKYHATAAPHMPDSWYHNKEHEAETPPNRARKASAKECYHVCVLEELAGTACCDCMNHSCTNHLPQLQSLYDVSSENRAIAKQPSALSGQGGGDRELQTDLQREHTNGDDNNDLITPIDSDDGMEELPFADKKTPTANKTPLTPILESDSEPDELSPNVRKANTAAVVRAKALGSPQSYSTPLPAYSSPRGHRDIPNIAAMVPLHSALQNGASSTGSPRSQGAEQLLSTPQMFQHQRPLREPQRVFITNQTIYPDLPTRAAVAPVTIFDLRTDPRQRERIEERRIQNEKEDMRARRAGGLWRGRGCMPQKGCFGRGGPEGRKKRRWLMCIAATLLLMIILCIILATTLHRGGDTAIQSQWLNLTGYPPMPTGISTIAQPNLVRPENRCVTPTTMWSCTLPKEDQASVAPNASNQPNLRFQISFQNGTVPTNMTIPITKRSTGSSKAGFFLPNPGPPSQPDQIFLGNTTDNVTTPYDGEQTPFFITFMSASPVLPSPYNNSQKLLTRDFQNSIPGPATESDGTASPASLLPTSPYPVSQPIKLYNRGHQDEHFGFYMYYDKSIFLANVVISNTTAANSLQPNSDADQNGGCLKSLANVRCTFSQTRFLVKIFTNPAFGATLLQGPQNLTATNSKTSVNSSATNFNQPGSFPYPATIILDRHGGSLNSKLTYCYGMSGGVINATQKQLVFEDRGFGGTLINPAPSVVADGSTFNANAGGIDGGTGGCGCTWQNWS